MEYKSRSVLETENLGKAFSKKLKPGDTVTLLGGLGAGKTAFARGIIHGLGYTGRVTSPTFAIANEYDTPLCPVAHVDLYRITSMEALDDTGFEEYFNGNRIVLIEWGENAGGRLPQNIIKVRIKYDGAEDKRTIYIGKDGKLEDTRI